jgi:mRNA interferase HigB
VEFIELPLSKERQTILNRFVNHKNEKMVVITKSTLYEFAAIHADVEDAIDNWYRKVRAADWSNFQDVKQTFRSADYAGNDRYVFNIKGNRYRLVALIHFNRRTLYIRFIGTHREYDDVDCSTI